jgi:hypothetical protein
LICPVASADLGGDHGQPAWYCFMGTLAGLKPARKQYILAEAVTALTLSQEILGSLFFQLKQALKDFGCPN